ncbi:MAG: RluA family pseudouridine synthase [Clostridia bacterium]|nr:RluA family pseudouridine synthase [Clostridia bacterium]
MIRHEIPESLRADELSRYLKRAWPLLPGHVLRDLLKKKDVRINGVKSGKGDQVRGGDILEIYAPEKHFAANAEVIFDDGRLMAAVKPQGLPSLPDADGVGADTMELRLKRIKAAARLCHRLDAGTGGVMLAAANEEVEGQAFEAFKQHQIRKTYRALLCKKPPKDEMVLKAQLTKDARHSTVRISDKPGKGSREIITRVKVRGQQSGLWDVELEPVTGRTHQLRAHMAFIGCPILGDDKYGDREKNRQLGFMNKLCLWCETLEIPAGSPLQDYIGRKFYAPCPDWMKK